MFLDEGVSESAKLASVMPPSCGRGVSGHPFGLDVQLSAWLLYSAGCTVFSDIHHMLDAYTTLLNIYMHSSTIPLFYGFNYFVQLCKTFMEFST